VRSLSSARNKKEKRKHRDFCQPRKGMMGIRQTQLVPLPQLGIRYCHSSSKDTLLSTDKPMHLFTRSLRFQKTLHKTTNLNHKSHFFSSTLPASVASLSPPGWPGARLGASVLYITVAFYLPLQHVTSFHCLRHIVLAL
jgi:hypothetical protein